MHEPGTAAMIRTHGALWAARTGAASICNNVWCIVWSSCCVYKTLGTTKVADFVNERGISGLQPPDMSGVWSPSPWRECCQMHVSHVCHMHKPGTAAKMWTYDALWTAHIGGARICTIVWCISFSNTARRIMHKAEVCESTCSGITPTESILALAPAPVFE